MSSSRSGLGLLGFAAGIGLAWGGAGSDGGYAGQIELWRYNRETRLKADGGWLTVAGLFWLEEGKNRFGTAPDNQIVLPEGSAPEHAGVFERQGATVRVHLEPGVEANLENKPLGEAAEMRPDTSGAPEVLEIGPRLRMHVIERGGRFGIRLKDLQSPLRKAFQGLHWFPLNESWRVAGRFEPYEPPRTLEIPNVLGQVDKMSCPGVVVFTHGGQELRLEPVVEDPDEPQLFFIFKDGTSGPETYGSGRFLYTEMPKDGQVVLDFNKAYSPPCAFTPYATCPLPPPQNRLKVRIEAGEKFKGHAEAR